MRFESPPDTFGDRSPGPLFLGQLGRGESVRRERLRVCYHQTGEHSEREGSWQAAWKFTFSTGTFIPGSKANGLHDGDRGSFRNQPAVMLVSSLSPPLPPLYRCPSTFRRARTDDRHLRACLFGGGNFVLHAVTSDVSR